MHALLADIATGHHAGADICFMVAVILFAVAALIEVAVNVDRAPRTNPPDPRPYYPGRWSLFLVYAGLAFIALGWLLL